MPNFPFQHLRGDIPIVNPDGTPTDYFLQMLFRSTDNAEQDSGDIQDKLSKTALLNTGTGLAGGGELGAPLTLILDAELDDLNDVDTASTPPADADILKYDAASSKWKPGAATGGGGSEVLGFKSFHTITDGANSAAEEDVPGLSVTFNLPTAGTVEVDFNIVLGRASGSTRLFINIDGATFPSVDYVNSGGIGIYNSIGMAEQSNQLYAGKQIIPLAAGNHTIKLRTSAVASVAVAVYKDRSLIVRRIA